MPKYTLSWISCWILSGPRLWLVLALVVSLVVGATVPTEVGQPAVWVWPDEVVSIGLGWRSSRIGRGVWRVGWVVWASRLRLTCRVGLMAGLVAASGLAVRHPAVWHWLWLPVADWVLSVMGWLWPTLLIRQGYQDLRGITHRAYQWSVVGLGLLAMQRWLNLGLTGMVLGNLVVCQGSFYL